MISNERPSPYGYRPMSHHGHHHPGAGAHRPPVNEETLRTEKLQIERKTFLLTLKENPRGRFLRITEDVNGRRDHIIIPATGLGEFLAALKLLAQTAEEAPPPTGEPPA